MRGSPFNLRPSARLISTCAHSVLSFPHALIASSSSPFNRIVSTIQPFNHPSPFDLGLSTFANRRSTFTIQPSSFDLLLSTPASDFRPSILTFQLSIFNPYHLSRHLSTSTMQPPPVKPRLSTPTFQLSPVNPFLLNRFLSISAFIPSRSGRGGEKHSVPVLRPPSSR